MAFLLSINSSDGLKQLQDTNTHDEFESLRQSARGEQTDSGIEGISSKSNRTAFIDYEP